MLRDILSGIASGTYSSVSLAASVGFDISELRAALALLEEKGYLQRMGCESQAQCEGGCRMCAGCMSCPSYSPHRQAMTYSLTDKGRRMIQ